MTSVETRPGNSRAISWIISLNYSERVVSSEKVKLHRLAQDLPYHDMKPPSGVRVIEIEAVHVRIVLMNPPTAAVPRPDIGKQGCVDSRFEDSAFDEESLFCDVDGADQDLLAFDDLGACDHDHLQNPAQATDESELQDSNGSASDTSCPYLTPPPSQEATEEPLQASDSDPIQHTTHHVNVEALMSSLETGLRHVMCRPSSRTSKANIIHSNEDFDSLPIIAPALWEPDYHKSLSERAVFLPTISHAIANVSGHNSATLGLKVKAWQLSHRHPHKGGETITPSASLSTNEVQEAISVDLWAAIASGLNHTRTAKRSRSLHDVFESTDGAVALGDAEPMLDETVTDCGSDGICDESEFEDLLDMASEADDVSMCDLAISETGDMCVSTLTEAFGDTLHRLPNRWTSEHPSRVDPGSILFEDCTELHENDSCGVLGSGVEEGGGSFGSHREISQCWSGSDPAHDSEVLQYPETAGAGSDSEDMLLWHLGDAGVKSPNGQVDSPMGAGTKDSEGLRGDGCADMFSDIGFAFCSEY